MGAYLSPSYFAPAYFGAGAPPAAAAATDARDDARRLAAVASRLAALGEFAAVGFPAAPPAAEVGSLLGPTAAVVPGGWREDDGADPARPLRTLDYQLRLRLHDHDPEAAFRRLDRLAARAQDQLDGSDLGGLVLPARSRIDAGAFDATRPPEWGLTLDGHLAYAVRRGGGGGGAGA